MITSAKAEKQETSTSQLIKDLGGKELSTKYFALYSLGEIALIEKSKQAKILELLFENSTSDDEGTRQVVSESLGKLAVANPELVNTFVVRIYLANLTFI